MLFLQKDMHRTEKYILTPYEKQTLQRNFNQYLIKTDKHNNNNVYST